MPHHPTAPRHQWYGGRTSNTRTGLVYEAARCARPSTSPSSCSPPNKHLPSPHPISVRDSGRREPASLPNPSKLASPSAPISPRSRLDLASPFASISAAGRRVSARLWSLPAAIATTCATVGIQVAQARSVLVGREAGRGMRREEARGGARRGARRGRRGGEPRLGEVERRGRVELRGRGSCGGALLARAASLLGQRSPSPPPSPAPAPHPRPLTLALAPSPSPSPPHPHPNPGRHWRGLRPSWVLFRPHVRLRGRACQGSTAPKCRHSHPCREPRCATVLQRSFALVPRTRVAHCAAGAEAAALRRRPPTLAGVQQTR